MAPSYAVLFKVHFWDDFTRRQLARLSRRADAGQIYVVVDESLGEAGVIEVENVIRIGREDFAALGLLEVTTQGSVIWYNTDYPHYIALSRLPDYEFYVCVEFDAVVNIDIDRLVAALDGLGVDYLGWPIRKQAAEWPWYKMHIGIYGPEMLVYLSCFSVFSARALRLLLERRQAMGQEFLHGILEFWPNNEAFLPNESVRSGLKIADLSDFAVTDLFDWWPPLEEADPLIALEGHVIHPVLNGIRYVRSIVHHEPVLSSFVRTGSLLRRKLRAIDVPGKRLILMAELWRRGRARLNRGMGRMGLKPQWFSNAKPGTAQFRQTRSPHNAAE